MNLTFCETEAKFSWHFHPSYKIELEAVTPAGVGRGLLDLTGETPLVPDAWLSRGGAIAILLQPPPPNPQVLAGGPQEAKAAGFGNAGLVAQLREGGGGEGGALNGGGEWWWGQWTWGCGRWP